MMNKIDFDKLNIEDNTLVHFQTINSIYIEVEDFWGIVLNNEIVYFVDHFGWDNKEVIYDSKYKKLIEYIPLKEIESYKKCMAFEYIFGKKFEYEEIKDLIFEVKYSNEKIS
jgi:hypothetical protein